MLAGNIHKIVHENGVVPKTVLTIEIPGINHDISIFEKVMVVTESTGKQPQEKPIDTIHFVPYGYGGFADLVTKLNEVINKVNSLSKG